MTRKKTKTGKTIKLIFNPHAGGKRKLISVLKNTSLQEIQTLMEQYQMPVDLAPTKGPKHATELAENARKEGYDMVVVAGGDGTVNEAANGLIDSNIPLGIIPLGSIMNISRMLSIPMDVEKAVALLKIRRVRKIDVGMLTKLNGEQLSHPYYFIESSGIGVEAHVQREFKRLENGHFSSLFILLKHILWFTPHKIEILTEKETFEYKANLVTIANAPLSGAALEMAPDAKLNDHYLTVVVYKMNKRELLQYFLRLILTKKTRKRELKIIKAKDITIKTKPEMFVHADASLFGTTPVCYKIKPSCLQVVCGFPADKKESSLNPRTNLDI